MSCAIESNFKIEFIPVSQAFLGCVSVGRCAIRTKLSRQCHALASSPAEKDAGEGTRVNGRDIL